MKMKHHKIMSNQKRNRLHRAIIFLGFSSHVFSCKSLNIDLPTHIRRRHKLQRPTGQLHNFLYSQAALKVSSKPDDEEQQPERLIQRIESLTSLQGRLAQYISVLRTAAVAFSAGSLAAIIFSMILFRNSLLTDDQNSMSFYQKAGAAKPSSSAQFSDKNNPADVNEQKQKAVVLYRSILEQLDEKYVDGIDPIKLFGTATRAMLSTLDPYTAYIPPQDMMQRKQQVGIGAFVMKAGNTPEFLDGQSVSTILSLIPSAVALPTQLLPSQDSQYMQSQSDGFHVVISLEGYAYDAGLRVGDEILEIDDQPVVGDSLGRVRELLVGVPGTKVKLTFKRPGINEVKSIYVERKVVQFPNVPFAGILSNDPTLFTNTGVSGDSYDDIGYIRLRRFGLDAGVSMEKAIMSIQSGRMKGLILDLRDNSGGELLSAVQIASLFFPDDTYLGSSKGKGTLYPNESYRSGKLDLTQYGYASSDNFPKSRNSMSSSGDSSIFKDGKQIIDPEKINIVILTNQRTASASEFLAGVFQDKDRAVIIGSDESTLGKGIGQREMGLPYGGGALKLTYHEFYTPSGRCVQRQYQEVQKEQNQLGEVFYTENGRVINNRRGIEVDYRAEHRVSLLSSLLSSSGAYFEFATEFCSGHQWSQSDSTSFVVNDQMYNSFKSFVLKEQRRGNLKLEEAFDEKHLLEEIEMLSAESTVDDSNLIQSSVANLRGEIVQDLLRDFDACEDIIRNELEQNIIARQLPDSELIKRRLKSDELVREAVQIIEDTKRYKELLGEPI